MHQIKVPATWTDDCQGKKDYDGELIAISTRYWPRGGGYSMFDSSSRAWEENEDRPGIGPHAHTAILVRGPEDEYYELVSAEFHGETFEEVAKQVEAWAQKTYNRIIKLLVGEFGELKEP
jgi:hypothetical protein